MFANEPMYFVWEEILPHLHNAFHGTKTFTVSHQEGSFERL